MTTDARHGQHQDTADGSDARGGAEGSPMPGVSTEEIYRRLSDLGVTPAQASEGVRVARAEAVHRQGQRADMNPGQAPTESDLRTLRNAAAAQRQEFDGIFPRDAGDRSHFRKLVRRGWLEFTDWGRDANGEIERDVELYKLTAAGEAAISALGGPPMTSPTQDAAAEPEPTREVAGGKSERAAGGSTELSDSELADVAHRFRDPASGDEDVLSLVAEVRGHRAREERLRIRVDHLEHIGPCRSCGDRAQDLRDILEFKP